MGNWIINSAEVISKDGDLSNVVYRINYTRELVKIIHEIEYKITDTNVIILDAPNDNNFVPYDELTFEDFVSWIEAKVNVIDLDNSLNINLDLQINPPIINKPLPF